MKEGAGNRALFFIRAKPSTLDLTAQLTARKNSGGLVGNLLRGILGGLVK
jgi:hypothetical protein